MRQRVGRWFFGLAVAAVLGLTIAGLWADVPQADRYASVHPAGTAAPLLGLAAESLFNTGTAAQLEALPGVGEVLAGRIIAAREAIGGFFLPEELLLVKGVGEKKLAEMLLALDEPLAPLPAGE